MSSIVSIEVASVKKDVSFPLIFFILYLVTVSCN